MRAAIIGVLMREMMCREFLFYIIPYFFISLFIYFISSCLGWAGLVWNFFRIIFGLGCVRMWWDRVDF